MPEETIAFVDGHYGPVEQNLARDCGDFILRRRTGVFAYQLAVVADDAAMGVTQVVRGRDLLSSAPRQIYLYRLLGFPEPEFAHAPLLLAPDGRRLSKRDRDVSLEALEEKGYTGPQIVGRLAFLAGLLDRPEAARPRTCCGVRLGQGAPGGRVPAPGAVLKIGKRGGALCPSSCAAGEFRQRENHGGQGPAGKIRPQHMLISHDMVRMQMLHVWGREGVLRSLPLLVELLRYGRQHSEVTILEGILPAGDYGPLFEAALEAYGTDIFAYYYDLPFEETLARHRTKPNRNDFGEEEMRRWWREKDLLPMLRETVFTKEVGLEEAVETIYRQVTGK